MRPASILDFIGRADALKEKYRRPLSNIFLSADKLRQLLESRHCLFHSLEASLFLLIPYHDSYYDFLYVSASMDSLRDDLKNFLSVYDDTFALRASITGKEPSTGEIATVFDESGFVLCKRLARIRTDVNPPLVQQLLKSQQEEQVGYACVSDAEEISEMLFEEFDLFGDNIPEFSEIIKNIEARQILVIRRGKMIGALLYFSIQNGQYSDIYDITRKGYRDEFLSVKFGYFLHRHIRRLAIPPSRFYGWRDATNKRLMKYSRLLNQTLDGVFIYHMVYKFIKHEIRMA
ncbi:MAG: hypothetical protein LBL72_10450 [Candidatus Accumulibacter sp.]|jgi:hypothetical protein|nr:hypothetical protein [Accumulibacter sp.]